MRAKRLFVIEFITGGGLSGTPLPGSLAHEGQMMLATLLRELGELRGYEVVTTRDFRCPTPRGPARCITIRPSDEPFIVFDRCIAGSDAVWPIAPETGGVLERLSRMVIARGRWLIGSTPEAIAVTAGKRRCAEVLAQAGIPAITTRRLRTGMGDPPVFATDAALPASDSGWVVKPDDGAGCADTYYFDDDRALRAFAERAPEGRYVVQAFVPGIPASLSLLCRDGQAVVLACNEQRIARTRDRLSCEGVAVHALRREHERLEPLAGAIARLLRGLAGFVGVDLVLTSSGPVVVEINPRLTSAYVGLAEGPGRNVAAAVLKIFERGPRGVIQRRCRNKGHSPGDPAVRRPLSAPS